MQVPVPAVSRQSLLCGAIYLLAFLPLAAVLRGHFGFPLDDSWIHQVIARNLAERHVIGFNPGVPSSGSTSLLWTLILAANTLLFPRLSPVITCAILGGVTLLAIGFSMKRLAEEDGLGTGASWSFALAPALSGNFLWFGLIGMEHLLFTLLLLVWLLVWFRPLHRTRLDRFLLYMVPLLLVLTRPEGFFLVALLLISTRLADRTGRDTLIAASGGVCGMAITCATNMAISGSIAPPTMKGRQFLFALNATLHTRLYFLGQSFIRITKTLVFLPPQSARHGPALVFGIALALLSALLISLAVRRLFILGAKRILFLSASAILIELLYFAVLPNPGHGGRYIALPIVIFLCLTFLGLYELFTSMFSDNRLAWSCVVACALATATRSISIWSHATVADIDQINSEHEVMAEWLQQNFPPTVFTGMHLAAFDIGRIGYQLEGHVIDLGGLVDSRYLPFLMEHRTAAYLNHRGVSYVVLPTEPDDTGFFAKALALDQSHGVRLSLVYSVCADPAVAGLAMESSAIAFPCQRLYAIGYGAVQ